MKILKENLKSIIAFIIGVILTGGITVYAATYRASDVTYKNDTSVASALDDLYNKIKDINKTDAAANDILYGKKAYTKDGLITGTLNTDYKKDTLSTGSTGNVSVDIGFRPSDVMIYGTINNTIYFGHVCELGFIWRSGGLSSTTTKNTLLTNGNLGYILMDSNMFEITSNGFSLKNWGRNETWNYTAIK